MQMDKDLIKLMEAYETITDDAAIKRKDLTTAMSLIDQAKRIIYRYAAQKQKDPEFQQILLKVTDFINNLAQA